MCDYQYSLEGHKFAIFTMKLTSDNRYIISCSNSFITFDVVTSDMARQVYPKVQGLMIGLELSPDNKFAAAWTNNNQATQDTQHRINHFLNALPLLFPISWL